MATVIGRQAENHEMFDKAVKAHARSTGESVEMQAARIGLACYGEARSADWLYKICQGLKPIPIEVWLEVQYYTRSNELVQRCCRHAGGVFVPMEALEAGQEGEALAAVSSWADMMKTTIDAEEDGVIDDREYAEINEKANRAVEMTGAYLAHVGARRQRQGDPRNVRRLPGEPKVKF